jgi:hypothetical protein
MLAPSALAADPSLNNWQSYTAHSTHPPRILCELQQKLSKNFSHGKIFEGFVRVSESIVGNIFTEVVNRKVEN